MKITNLSQTDDEDAAYEAWLAGLPEGAGITQDDAMQSIGEPGEVADDSVTVTKLTPSAHDHDRVNVFLDGRFSFSLNIAQVVDFKLKIGKKITPAECEKYRRASEFGKLYQHALEWVLSRPHSIYETRDHLKRRRSKRELINRRVVSERNRKENEEYYGNLATSNSDSYYDLSRSYRNERFRVGRIYKEAPVVDENGFFTNEPRKRRRLPSKELPLYSDEDIEAVIERLIERKYLDDEKFARYFIENRNATKGISLRKLRAELQQKGVDGKLVDQLMSEGNRDEKEEIRKVIAKKSKKYSGDRLITYLVRRGFDYQLSRDAVAEMDSQNPA